MVINVYKNSYIVSLFVYTTRNINTSQNNRPLMSDYLITCIKLVTNRIITGNP